MMFWILIIWPMYVGSEDTLYCKFTHAVCCFLHFAHDPLFTLVHCWMAWPLLRQSKHLSLWHKLYSRFLNSFPQFFVCGQFWPHNLYSQRIHSKDWWLFLLLFSLARFVLTWCVCVVMKIKTEKNFLFTLLFRNFTKACDLPPCMFSLWVLMN